MTALLSTDLRSLPIYELICALGLNLWLFQRILMLHKVFHFSLFQDTNIAPFTATSHQVYIKFHAEYVTLPSGFHLSWTS